MNDDDKKQPPWRKLTSIGRTQAQVSTDTRPGRVREGMGIDAKPPTGTNRRFLKQFALVVVGLHILIGLMVLLAWSLGHRASSDGKVSGRALEAVPQVVAEASPSWPKFENSAAVFQPTSTGLDSEFRSRSFSLSPGS